MATSTIEPLETVRPAGAAKIENCGETEIHRRINAREYESYLDGKRRLITLRSIRARQERLLKETAGLKRRAGPGRPKKIPSTEITA
jgi:hypothetical protein